MSTAGEYSYVPDSRDQYYNMVYVPPNPSTGLNGHFSLVSSPNGHQEWPTSAEVPASSASAMHEAWQTQWAGQSGAPQCGMIPENQHYAISSGFATPTEAEMALSAAAAGNNF